jgi:hypothetical protein
MTGSRRSVEPTVERHVFPTWFIRIPRRFAETYVASDGYWHGYDERRSVSLTSVVVTERRRPVAADRILKQAPSLDGVPVDVMPPGLLGRAATSSADPDARASQILSGLLAIEGRILLVTITSDDLEWARRVWLSIRTGPVSVRVYH